MIWRLGFLACALIIGYGSLTPSGGDILHVWDKFQHFGAYCLLALLGLLGWGRLPRATTVVLAAVVAYGGLIEIIQHFVGRDMSAADFFTDILGAATAFALWRAAPKVLQHA